MERMAGGQDSWARWKSVVLALPRFHGHSYLRDVEGYSPGQIASLLEGEDATVLPSDWTVTEESKQALARYEAWEQSLTSDGDETITSYQEARGAALPSPQEVPSIVPGEHA
jgi:hypothetical protein